MTEQDGQEDEEWWSRKGIRSRWDEERETGPPKVILAKFIRESFYPAIFGVLAAGFMTMITLGRGLPAEQVVSFTVAAFSGVYYVLYNRAGFRDATLRGD